MKQDKTTSNEMRSDDTIWDEMRWDEKWSNETKQENTRWDDKN